MLRRVGQYVLAAVLALVASNAVPQVISEFRDTTPGSLLFGVLQVIIASSGAAGAVGTLRRARWAGPAIAVCGTAAVWLLLVQPLYEPMDAGDLRSLLLGATLVGVVTAGMTWFARRLARPAVAAGLGGGPALQRGGGSHHAREASRPTVAVPRTDDADHPDRRAAD